MNNLLNADIRSHASKGENHRLRKEGKIPGVIYGMKDPNLLVEFGEMDLCRVLDMVGEHGVVDIDITGIPEIVIIKEIQRDPVTRRITHLDLQRIDEAQIIKTKVPVVLRGQEYYRNSGSILQQQLNQLEVECTPNRLPKCIFVDVSHLENKHRITVGDIEAGEEISILNNPLATVVSLTYSKNTSTEEESPNTAMAMHWDDTP